jgi:sn-glycerol 3-phosphate transport system substrate-binding protein
MAGKKGSTLFGGSRCNPGTAISIEQITLKPPTENSRGLRLGSFILIRDAIDDELEQAFGGKKSAQAALDSAVERGNRLLRQFERTNPDRSTVDNELILSIA